MGTKEKVILALGALVLPVVQLACTPERPKVVPPTPTPAAAGPDKVRTPAALAYPAGLRYSDPELDRLNGPLTKVEIGLDGKYFGGSLAMYICTQDPTGEIRVAVIKQGSVPLQDKAYPKTSLCTDINILREMEPDETDQINISVKTSGQTTTRAYKAWRREKTMDIVVNNLNR